MDNLIKIITINNHGNIMVSLSYSGDTIVIWTVKEGKIVKKYCNLLLEANCLAISLDSSIMAIGGSEVILVCIKNWKIIRASLAN